MRQDTAAENSPPVRDALLPCHRGRQGVKGETVGFWQTVGNGGTQSYRD